jgi:ribosomal protein L11 methyltransferase
MEAWKQHYKPILIGQRLVILPAWMDSPEPNRIPIKIDPGMAFGTGTHPTTQLCLELMEKYFDERQQTRPAPGDSADPDHQSSKVNRPSSMIDVGCGSGILSIAAIKLGAKSALGVDIDSGSIDNARQNAETNSIGHELILGVGSVHEIREGKFPFRKAPLVVANILAPVISRLFDAGLADLIEEDGVILLSGILQDQAQGVIEAAQTKGLRWNGRKQMGDWVALSMSR